MTVTIGPSLRLADLGGNRVGHDFSGVNKGASLGEQPHQYCGILDLWDRTNPATAGANPLLTLTRGDSPSAPVKPAAPDTPAISVSDVIEGNGIGGTLPAAIFSSSLVSGSRGIAVGVRAYASAGGSYNPVSTDSGGAIGAKLDGVSGLDSTYAQYVGSWQGTARGQKTGDIIQGFEQNIATATEGISVPGQRIGGTIATAERSSRASGLDVALRLAHKIHAYNDSFKVGLLFGDGYDTAGALTTETYGVLPEGTLIRAQPGRTLHGLDFHQVTFDGSSLQLPNFTVAPNGNLGIGIGTGIAMSALQLHSDDDFALFRLSGANKTGNGAAMPGSYIAYFNVRLQLPGGSWVIGKVPVIA